MKSFVSVKGVLVVVILLVAALSAGTALAARQSAVSPQVSLKNVAGASIVINSTCMNPTADDPATLTVWGSGWASEELVLLSIIKNATDVGMLSASSVNAAGATVLSFDILPQGQYSRKEKRVQAPPPGIYTLEALGTSGRLATAPIIVAEDKCPGA